MLDCICLNGFILLLRHNGTIRLARKVLQRTEKRSFFIFFAEEAVKSAFCVHRAFRVSRHMTFQGKYSISSFIYKSALTLRKRLAMICINMA